MLKDFSNISSLFEDKKCPGINEIAKALEALWVGLNLADGAYNPK